MSRVQLFQSILSASGGKIRYASSPHAGGRGAVCGTPSPKMVAAGIPTKNLGVFLRDAKMRGYAEADKVIIVLIINTVVHAMRRGPHHPHGQTPVEHHHYKPRGASLTGDDQLLHDAQHIEEDSKILTPEAIAKMTPEELEFHYFSAHDFDRNSKLDGLELLKAIYHTLEHETPDPDDNPVIEPEADELDAYIALVDKTLESDDTDGDGYVSYAEYRAARENNPGDRSPRVVLTP